MEKDMRNKPQLNPAQLITADLYMALGGQVVDFVGTYLVHKLDQGHGVGHVGIMQMEMGGAFEMGDALAIVYG